MTSAFKQDIDTKVRKVLRVGREKCGENQFMVVMIHEDVLSVLKQASGIPETGRMQRIDGHRVFPTERVACAVVLLGGTDGHDNERDKTLKEASERANSNIQL